MMMTLVAVALVSLTVFPSWVSSVHVCQRWDASGRALKLLNDTFKTCPLNCNSTQITDNKCHCFNVNTPEKCAFPTYLISGLKAVNRTVPESSKNVQYLIDRFSVVNQRCKTSPSCLPEICLSSVSPHSFFKTMEQVLGCMASSSASKRK
ncbi:hypothetical protein WMY93_008856 [Mugilogobius chulae]|uniref:Uncharacterized protein n=1 Tax=Mugilogobius chulae TaxID=88201 RepID=A0AAW0PGA6_9GOBI